MSKVIYTVGYGLLKGSHEERKKSFQKRLEYIRRGIGMPITLMDIRKKDCGSRNGPWCSWDGMRETIRELWPDEKHCSFIQYPYLANEFGSTKEGFRKYQKAIRRQVNKKSEISSLELIIFHMNTWKDRAYVLLCGCNQAYKSNGLTPNCHRVCVADALVKLLGADWSVVHL